MKTFLTVSAIMTALLCGTAFAQDTTPPSTNPGTGQTPVSAAPQTSQQPQSSASEAPRIAPGSVIPVELTKTIDAKKAKTGDEVVAKVTQDMKSPSGEVLVPKDTKVVGHVTEAQARNKERKGSELGIAFDHALTKTGDTKLPMSIQAIVAPASMSPANDASGGGGEPTGPASGGATATSPMGGRNGATPAQPQQLPTSGTDAQPSSSPRPPINASTQGVIGMPNLKLAANGENATQGSVVTSEKDNVKLESGTLLLLRVSQ
jgi:hypothetical protein